MATAGMLLVILGVIILVAGIVAAVMIHREEAKNRMLLMPLLDSLPDPSWGQMLQAGSALAKILTGRLFTYIRLAGLFLGIIMGIVGIIVILIGVAL